MERHFSMSSAEEMLQEFHMRYGHLVSGTPTLVIPERVKRLRHNLVMEEIQETTEAMGFFQDETGFSIFKPEKQNLVEIADGIADSIYVLIGTAVSYGIPIGRIFNEVHNSNMTKTAVKAEDGNKYGTKTPKGPDYLPPDIVGILTNPERKTALELKNSIEEEVK